MSNLSLYCLKYAESTLPESMVFDGGNRQKCLPISFAVYLIVTADKTIMVDAGCDTMPGFDMQDFCSPSAVLRQVGMSPENVTDVIITHAHHDHIEAVKYFKNAVVHITEREYGNGKHYIPEAIQVHVFENEYYISPNIKILEWAGHSNGSAIVEIQTDGIVHVFAGDECYTDANVAQKWCTGVYYDREKAVAFIEKYSQDGYRVHTCHDSSLKTERIVGYESSFGE